MLRMAVNICAAALLSSAALTLPAVAQETSPPRPIWAEYGNPTDRYPHNIMGSLQAHTDLIVRLAACQGCEEDPRTLAIRLPGHLVFEDFAPRLVDLNGDGRDEIVVVESDQKNGARLAVWDVIVEAGTPRLVRGAATDFIGKRFRWLAPIGAADLDGDGAIEFAYVEKPHLDKILRIVRREGDQLRLVLSVPGVTNHAIGQEDVQSRIEICAGRPTILALDASGRLILSIRLIGGVEEVTEVGRARERYRLDNDRFCGS